jgi:hypothetical protein
MGRAWGWNLSVGGGGGSGGGYTVLALLKSPGSSEVRDPD